MVSGVGGSGSVGGGRVEGSGQLHPAWPQGGLLRWSLLGDAGLGRVWRMPP